MMQVTAEKMGVKRRFFAVPFFTPTLSRLWVSLISNTPKNLVYPLIESLQHPMVARNDHLFSAEPSNRSYFDLLEKASLKTHRGKSLFRFRVQRKTVRSVQRLPLPEGKNAEWLKNEFVEWLPRFLSPLIGVKKKSASVEFSLFNANPVLLELKSNQERSDSDNQLLYIIRGLMVAEDNRGRLEFRVVLNRKFVLAAIHDYRPALPWYIYRYTQAKLHLMVMRAFGRNLQPTKNKGKNVSRLFD